MKCRSFCPFTAVVAFVGLIGLGVAGYAMLSDNCIFGTCGDRDARDARATEANIVTTAASSDTCPLGGCDSDVTTVAATECKDLTDGCVGDGKGDCCGGCGDEAKTLAAGHEKATCETACESDTANVLTVAAKGDNGENAEECAALTGDCKGDGKNGCCGNCLETEKPAEKAENKACCQEG